MIFFVLIHYSYFNRMIIKLLLISVYKMKSYNKGLFSFFIIFLFLFLFQSVAVASIYDTKQATLLSVYHDAVLYNSDIAAAKADYNAKQQSIPQAMAGLLPEMNITGSLENSRVDISHPDITHHYSGKSFQANINQPIFRLDRWHKLSAAKNSVLQAEYEYISKQQLLILQSAEYYFEVLRASDLLAVAKTEENAYKVQLEQTEGRRKGGISTVTDVLDAQAAYDMAQANTELAERKLADAYEQLTRLTHISYRGINSISHDLPILPPVPNSVDAWIKTANNQNLSILAAKYNVKSAQDIYKQYQAGHAPTLDLKISYRKGDNDAMGYSNTTSSGYRGNVSQSNVSLQLNIPIFSGGITNSQTEEALQRLLQSEELEISQQREVFMQTKKFFRGLNSDIYQIKARKQTMISSYKAEIANQEGYRFGNRSMTDVLTAQRQLYTAVRDYNNARYDYILNNLRLKQIAGSLNVEDLQNLQQFLLTNYDPDHDFLPPELIKNIAIKSIVK